MQEQINVEELASSLNGFEELAIVKAFGFQMQEFDSHGTMGARALLFIAKKREGAKDSEAYKAAMTVPQKELMELFDTNSGDELAAEDSESGKD